MPKGSEWCLPLVLALFEGLACGPSVNAKLPSPSAYDATLVPDSVTNMDQLSPGVGWVVTLSRHILWTNDNGTVWNDITPPARPDEMLVNFFFVDSKHGWAVFVGPGEGAPQEPVRMVRTQNGGKTWTPLHFDGLSYPGWKNEYAGPRRFWFVDARHGWFQWLHQSGSAFSFGSLFGTMDGGVTWKELPCPSGDEFQFYTRKHGWIVTGASSDGLSETHDGGKTWQDVTMPLPENCEECHPGYDVPRFQDKNNGIVRASLTDDTTLEGRTFNVTYVTHDAGRTWQITEVIELTDLPYVESGIWSMLDGHEIRVLANNETDRIQIRDGANTISSPYPSGLAPGGSVEAVSFADGLNGWLIYSVKTCTKFRNAGPAGWSCDIVGTHIDLLATTDGGKTFKVISPILPPIAE
jgi:photosystem II stability/assembly factor-like uncharacterized protein